MSRASKRPGALPRSMWLLSESRRGFLALVLGIGCMVAVDRTVLAAQSELADLDRTDPAGASLLLVVACWAVLAICHTALTWFTFHGLYGQPFRVAIAADPGWQKYDARRRSIWFRWFVGVGPGSWSVTLAIFSLIAVVAMVLRPGLRATPVALGIALAMVAVSWVSVTLTYALHYARLSQSRGGLDFPGEGARGLSDYLYLALAIQSTFGTTDVSVTSREMRVQVTTQGLLAFVFNTVIVAMVLSLLLGLTQTG